MKIEEIVPYATDVTTIIRDLKIRTYEPPDVAAIEKQINTDLHDVNNRALRPDKPVRDDSGKILRIEPVNRISLDFEDLVIQKAVNFALGNPVKRTYNNNDTPEGAIIEQYLERVLRDNMSLIQDREVARNIFTWTECAEYWYPKQLTEAYEAYGFSTMFKLKCSLFSPEKGDKLFPKFDEFGDMVAFSREYEVKVVNQIVTFFQTFTDEQSITWKRNGLGQWDEVANVPLTIGKMPIIYGRQPKPEHAKIESLRPRLELLLSNHAEVNDYHSGPKILVSGQIDGWGQKGQNNMILQAKNGADAKYLSWDSAPVSVQNEIDNLLMQMYTLSQTPNISFDNIKGIGAVSGIAIKLLFMDAHLKVKDKEGIFLPFFQRRYSVINAYVSKLQADEKLIKAAKLIEADPTLDPYMIADDKEQAEITMTLNGNQPVKSQLQTVKEYGGTQETYNEIIAEEKERSTFVLGQPTQ